MRSRSPYRSPAPLSPSKGSRHAQQFEDSVTGMECLPEALRGRRYYFPADRGIEKRIGERLEELRRKMKSRAVEPRSGVGS